MTRRRYPTDTQHTKRLCFTPGGIHNSSLRKEKQKDEDKAVSEIRERRCLERGQSSLFSELVKNGFAAEEICNRKGGVGLLRELVGMDDDAAWIVHTRRSSRGLLFCCYPAGLVSNAYHFLRVEACALARHLPVDGVSLAKFRFFPPENREFLIALSAMEKQDFACVFPPVYDSVNTSVRLTSLA